MDPKALNNLDPKLQETYSRVMGTPTPPTSASTPPIAAITNTPAMTTSEIPPQTDSSSTIPAYAADNLKFQAAIQAPVAGIGGAAIPASVGIDPQIPLPHQSSPLLKVLYIIGAIVFFVVYTFVWIKIFNLPVPFLN